MIVVVPCSCGTSHRLDVSVRRLDDVPVGEPYDHAIDITVIPSGDETSPGV